MVLDNLNELKRDLAKLPSVKKVKKMTFEECEELLREVKEIKYKVALHDISITRENLLYEVNVYLSEVRTRVDYFENKRRKEYLKRCGVMTERES